VVPRVGREQGAVSLRGHADGRAVQQLLDDDRRECNSHGGRMHIRPMRVRVAHGRGQVVHVPCRAAQRRGQRSVRMQTDTHASRYQ